MELNWDPHYTFRAPFETLGDIVGCFFEKAPLKLWKNQQNPLLLLKKTMFWDAKGAFSKSLANKVSRLSNSNSLNFQLFANIFSAS